MPRLANYRAYNPTLQFRYTLFWAALPTAIIYARSAQMPIMDNSPVTVDFKNSSMKIKGKTKWNDISLQCYAFEGITVREIWSYVNKYHQQVKGAIDSHPAKYKMDMHLVMQNPMGIPVGRWKLTDAFISTVSWGDLDWGGNDVVQSTITISYDYAELLFP